MQIKVMTSQKLTELGGYRSCLKLSLGSIKVVLKFCMNQTATFFLWPTSYNKGALENIIERILILLLKMAFRLPGF